MNSSSRRLLVISAIALATVGGQALAQNAPTPAPAPAGKTATPPPAAAKPAPAKAASAATTTVKVTMSDDTSGKQTLTLDQASVKAGKVKFEVTNASKQNVHEFLLVKTSLTPDKLPLNAAGDVDEKKLAGIKEVHDLKPGKNGSITLSLAPGHYVAFCNQPGHFKAGMSTELTVTSGAGA